MLEFFVKHTLLVLIIFLIRYCTRKACLSKAAMIIWLLIPLHALLFWTTELQFVPKTVASERLEKADHDLMYIRLGQINDSGSLRYQKSAQPGNNNQTGRFVTVKTVMIYVWGVGALCTMIVFLYRIISELRFFLKRRTFLFQKGKMLVYSLSGYNNASSIGKRIYLGEEAVMDSKTLDYIISHEEAHFLHKDTAKNIGLILYLTVFWFLPTNHALTKWIKIDCEIASDLYVTKSLSEDEKKDYCNLLLSMKNPVNPVLGTAFSEEYKALRARIEAVKSHDATKKKRNRIISAIVLSAMTIAFIFLLGKSQIYIPGKEKLDIADDVYVKGMTVEEDMLKFRLVNVSEKPYIIYKITIEKQTADGSRGIYKWVKKKKEKSYALLPETKWMNIHIPDEAELNDLSRDDYLHYIRMFKLDESILTENGEYELNLYITDENRPYLFKLVQYSFVK